MRTNFDAVVIGGSYSGLAAAMALGRALRKVMVIDSGKPANRQTPFSHNFLTHDGTAPTDIARLAKAQVQKYDTVHFVKASAKRAQRHEFGFEVWTDAGESFTSRKLIFATGVKDITSEIPGLSDCWGISVLHCPYCHGYEVKNVPTGILGNGDYAFEFASLIYNWTKQLTVYSNGRVTLSADQRLKLERKGIGIVEDEIEKLDHIHGNLEGINFRNGNTVSLSTLYTKVPFTQHCLIPAELGCEIASDGYVQVDASMQTTQQGVFACGDNTTRMRTVANAVAMGTTAGMMVNKTLVIEDF